MGFTRYRGDPRLIIAKYPGIDLHGNPFPAGTEIFWYPRTRQALQGEEAKREYRAFVATAEDEDEYNRGYRYGPC
jgi:hypothetical protein